METINAGFVKDVMRMTEPANTTALGGFADLKTPPPPTEMQSVGDKLAYIAQVLEEAADRLQGRVDSFTQRGEAATGQAVDPTPMPGTLAHIHHWIRRIDVQSVRIAAAVEDVSTIL